MADTSSLGGNVADVLASEIEALVESNELRSALQKLRIFTIDYCRHLSIEVTHLLSRLNRYESERRMALNSTENINDISYSVLAVLSAARQDAKPPGILPPLTLIDLELEPTRPDKVNNTNRLPLNTNKLRRTIIQNTPMPSGAQSEPVVIVQNLERIFSSNPFLLKGVSLNLSPGQITVVIGSNGSGKTTLLRLIAGLLRPTSGSVRYPQVVNQRDWASIRSQISYISSISFKPNYDVRHTLEFIAAACGTTGLSNKNTVADYLARYDLEKLSNLTWAQQSDGYLMRFELVRALVTSPRLLILDEPLAHLDFLARSMFLQELDELAAIMTRPISILMSTHHAGEAELIADQLVVLDRGACKFVGTKQELRQLVRGSIFHLYGDLRTAFVEHARKTVGVEELKPILGGIELKFLETITLDEVISRLKGIDLGDLTSIIDVSGSPENILRQKDAPLSMVRS